MIRPFRFWRQYIATALIFTLLVSQTIRVDFFSEAEASQDAYRDIVSIVVDRDTYDVLDTEVKRYAEDIQTYLGSTRTAILVVDPDTAPAQIAAQNERLYYEGDGDKGIISHLVGTILIGDIAIPMVDAGDEQFPSVYPYVDFVDKKFLYDETSKRYITARTDTQKIIEPEIWHGVINPAVGRQFVRKEIPADPSIPGSQSTPSDIAQISQFLDKTHEFYTQKGVFAPSTIPPRVFYYDGFSESQSFILQDLAAYKLYLSHAEELIYNRYSKYFLQYITDELEKDKAQFEVEERAYLESFGMGAAPIADEFAQTPDIHTRSMILALMKKFHDLINKQALGNIRGFVRNAGRYNSGSEVRVDQPAINISLMDYSAMNTIRKINDKIEKHIDEIEVGEDSAGMGMGAMPPHAGTTIRSPKDGVTRTYDSYIFGQRTLDIDIIEQCNIARGSDYTAGPYKQGILVEANAAFDVRSTQKSMENFEIDGKKRIDCAPVDDDQATYETDVYWGKNIITNVDTTSWLYKKPSNVGGYINSILSLGGMNEVTDGRGLLRLPHEAGANVTTDITPLYSRDCYGSHKLYMIQVPRGDSNASTDIKEAWPLKVSSKEKTGKPSISCLTEEEEFSLTDWEGYNSPPIREDVPAEFDWISGVAGPGDDPNSFAAADPGERGICAYGQIALYLAPKSSDGQQIDYSSPKKEDFRWSCLPKWKDCQITEGQLMDSVCFSEINKYITELTTPKSEVDFTKKIACPAINPKTPELGKPKEFEIYNTACGILGDASGKRDAPYQGNFRSQYWKDLPSQFDAPNLGGMFQSPCAGFAAIDTDHNTKTDGSGLPNMVANLCMVIPDPRLPSGGGDSEVATPQPIDLTTYETSVHRSMDSAQVFHKSPTDAELAAAEKNGMTPSLPIDHDRYMTWSHTVGGEWTTRYPNLFRFNEEEILQKYSKMGILKRDAGGGVTYPVSEPDMQAQVPAASSGTILFPVFGTGRYIITPTTTLPSQLMGSTGDLIRQKYGTTDIYTIARATGTLLIGDASYTGWTFPVGDIILTASGERTMYRVSPVIGLEMKAPTLDEIAKLPKVDGKYPGQMRPTQTGAVTVLDIARSPSSRLIADQYGSGVYLITPILPPKGILSKLSETKLGRDLIEKYGSGAYLIAAYRYHLNDLGVLSWGGMKPGGAILTANPPDMPCWGGAIGADVEKCVNTVERQKNTYDPIYGIITDDEIAAVIRAKRWLHPDVTLKYQQAIETGLSYSHQYNSSTGVLGNIPPTFSDIGEFLSALDGAVTGPPKIPTMTGGYEIAYLGLTQFIPKGEGDDQSRAISSGGKSVAGLSTQYADSRAALTGLNISEQDREDQKKADPSPSDACGPPEGVELSEWPDAIQCWIKSLSPLISKGQACGANSIGLDAGIFASPTFAGVATGPVVSPRADQISSSTALATFYSGARLSYHLSRDVILPGESIDARIFYTRDGNRLTVPSGSDIRLDIESITDWAGKTVDRSAYSDYMTIAPNPTTLTENGAALVLQGANKIGKITLRAKLTLRAADDTTYTAISDVMSVQVSDEYLVAIPTVDGKVTSMIPVTSSGMTFDFTVKNLSGDILEPIYPITLDIFDDVWGMHIATGITINTAQYTLPRDYTRDTGVSRLEFVDKRGRHAINTIAIQAGPVARASISPISSAILKGSDTLVTLRLRDALGNPIRPDLHSIEVTASGGYFILESGEKKTSMHIDAIESEIPLRVGSDIVGEIQLEAVVDANIRTSKTLTVFESARVIISRTGTPQVGGESIPVTLRVVGTDNEPISGFQSVVSLSLPSGAGVFTPAVATLTGGISEQITYTPGRLAGVHQVRASVPGLGPIPGIDFSVEPGKPMYITHTEDDNSMIFSIRDRYDNIVPTTLTGTIELGGSTPKGITFASGVLIVEKKTGYMIVDVPVLALNTIRYTDSEGEHTIHGISTYVAWITSLNKRFDFTADYNARYTILAGGEFLREAEDILYNTTPGSGASLAVTTLLDTPYKTDTLLSIAPGGGFSITDTPESILEPSITLSSGYPLLSVRDAVSSSIITRALYHADDATLDVCTGAPCALDPLPGAHIRLETTATGYIAQKNSNGSIGLLGSSSSLVTIQEDGRVEYLPGITLSIDADRSTDELVMDIFSVREQIGTLYYKTDSRLAIVRQSDQDTSVLSNTVILDNTTSTELEPYSPSRLADTLTGYRYIKRDTTPIIDEDKNGPEAIESIAQTIETPGVGWQNTNRMMLSYAGGDTVGAATRWFHTYTLVNLGDPVAHNDRKAPGTELDGIDRSIGTQLTSSQASPVQSYAQRDMDDDGYDDIVVAHTDGHIELLLNLGDRVRSRGNIAYVPDITSRGLSLGDFTADGYADILGVDKMGSFIMLSNDQRQFTRTRVAVRSGATLPTGVTQFQIRDMDADTRDDIAYITDRGELSILYGTDRAGVFDKKVLDATLGLSLSATPIKTGGAIFALHIPQVSLASGTGTGLDESLIWNEVYVPYISSPSRQTTTVDMSDPGALTSLDTYFDVVQIKPSASQATNTKNFVRSEYASAHGLDISKKYSLGSGTTLHAGQRIRVDIDIHNTRATTISAIEYLDTIPQIFSTEKTLKYTIKNNGTAITRDFANTSSSDYDAHFSLPDIAPGQTSTISYELTALPTSYGELLVGDYEQGETGADAYMDVGFKTATTCGADMMLWRSHDTILRDYTKGTRSFSDATFGSTLADKLSDADGNGVPDSIENLTASGQMADDAQQRILDNITHKPGTAPSKDKGTSSTTEAGQDEGSLDEIEGYAKEITDALGGCGGNAGNTCVNYPINWAPLAPGSDIVAFGQPIGDGLLVNEGIPLMSGLTRMDIGASKWCVTFPVIWPISPMSQSSTKTCNSLNIANAWGEAVSIIASGGKQTATDLLGAGGMIGSKSATNFFRLYVTPTLTMGVGVAMCMEGPAETTSGTKDSPGTGIGWKPPPGSWPATQGGNCLVVAQNVNMCSNDGSVDDGDIRNVVGLGSTRDTWNAGNGSNAPTGGGAAGSCNIVAQTASVAENQTFTQDIISYVRSPDKGRLPGLYSTISKRPPRTSTSIGPALSMNGSNADGAAASVDISIDMAKPLTADNIVKLKNKRISGFPEFLMDWVSRQTDEMVNALFTPPALIIIPPTSIGQNAQFDGTLSGLTSTFKASYNKDTLSSISTTAGTAYDKNSKSSGTGTVDKLKDTGKGGLAAMRAAYQLIGKLPLITISEKKVPIDIPWILKTELDQYAKSLDAYGKEAKYMIDSFCANDPSPECLAQKAQIQSSGLISSINENLKRIEEYKNFPIKLQKYITWKQRYLGQILCYITTIQEMTTGWLKDNSVRFKKWAELIVLLRAIAKGWQPLLDIINKKDAECAVCHNERHNSKDWRAKLISMLIPSIPVIQFPRWPDIVLDLSDIRFGIIISMPDFQFNLKPIRLPSLPTLSLPRGPNVSLSIPPIPVLPAIPNLPDLPDLPTLETIKLPNLPPPPKIPKILGALEVIIKILKVYKMMECYVNKTPWTPEWAVGDVIAQRTERQGTNPLDFIDISLPQISIPTIKELRISTHVNFEIRSDFVTEFARAAVAPLNQFGADLGRGTPAKVAPDVNLQTPTNINLNTTLQSVLPVASGSLLDGYIAELVRDQGVLLDTDEFAHYLTEVFRTNPELTHLVPEITDGMRAASLDAKKETDTLIAYQGDRYNLLRDYISAQYDETAHMQEIVDLLTTETHILSSSDMDRALMVSDTLTTRSSVLAQEFNTLSTEALTPPADEHPMDSLSDVAGDLQDRVRRLAAIGDTGPDTLDIDTAAGYTPNFQGIYIVTEKGTQTRLFDYTESLQKTDVSTKVDIDRDGDMDYLYLLGGTLFLKRTSTAAPTSIVDTDTQVKYVGPESPYPTAPDFFTEDASIPGTITLSYAPAMDTETVWRVDFYDRYLEWDMYDRDEHDEETTPRHIVELYRQDLGALPTREKSVQRSLSKTEDPASLTIEGPKMQVLTGAMDFVLSPGRTLYTGNRPVTIRYSTGTTITQIEKKLDAHRGYAFDDLANVSMDEGTLYIVYPSIVTEHYPYSDALIGMPILPGMHITSGGGEVRLIDHLHDEDITISPGSIYRIESITRLGSTYSAEIPYPNGFYYARIQGLDATGKTTARETLFTPQLSSDTSAPDLDIRDTIRVPVYQSQDIPLRTIITETNPYILTIDTDVSQDTDGNGVYDDDFVSDAPGLSITGSTLKLGVYDTIGRRTMMFRVVDEYHNTTYLPVAVEVYAPIPRISDITSSGSVRGSAGETLLAEPIHLFRVRTGTDIKKLHTGAILTTSGGLFQSADLPLSVGAILSSSEQKISISDRGVFGPLPSGYTSRVTLSNSGVPLHIDIADGRGAGVYRQMIVLPTTSSIVDTTNNSSTGSDIIAITPGPLYTLVSASVSDPSIPGGYYLVDAKNTPFFALARDGNIYPLATGVTAVISDRDGYPNFTISYQGSTIAELLYKFDFFYTLK